MLNTAILIIGSSGIIAQVLLLRELLVAFYGNELIIGLILANWVVLEAAGAYIIGKSIEKSKSKIGLFVSIEVIFSFTFTVSIYACRVFKPALGISQGETPGLLGVLFSSFIILLAPAFCHGALFSAGCALYSERRKKTGAAIGKVYSWETIGTIAGGLLLTYFFIPYLDSFRIAFIVAIANLFACFFFFKHIAKRLQYILTLAALLVAGFFFLGGFGYLQRVSVARLWRGENVLAYRNSIYGNICVTENLRQYTFYYNGSPVITTPYPDITFTEEFGHLPLLFSQKADDILVLGAGAGGLLTEILKHPVKKVDYAELDPLLIGLIKDFPAELTRNEFSDRRLNIINQDARFFVRNSTARYDTILIGLSRPSDLASNRLFTAEFFAAAKERMNPAGLLALRLDGSLTYLSRQLKDLNACVFNGLKNIFTYVRVIPGDYNLYLASESDYMMALSPQLLARKLSEQNIKTKILLPQYLEHRLDKERSDWFKAAMAGATEEVNRDLRPLAVYQTLLFWNKRFWPGSERLFASLRDLTLGRIAGFMLLLTMLLAYLFRRAPKNKFPVAYSIFTTGFFGMSATLLLSFSFQVFYGYLYYALGLFISIFMAGAAAGSLLVSGAIEKIKHGFKLFIAFESALIVFTFLVAVSVARPGLPSVFLFTGLFFVAGLLMGIEFPLAGRIYAQDTQGPAKTVGALYGADLMGAWLAGLSAGALLLPVLGFFNSCMVIAVFKLSSLALLLTKARI